MQQQRTEAFEIAPAVVPQELVDDALRLLHLELLSNGATAEQLSEWLWATHWFPELKWRDEITALASALPPEWQIGQMCDPQILLQFPHVGPQPKITFHTDKEPDWAGSRRYLRIVGVPLSPWRAQNGALLVRVDDDVRAVEIDPGDAVSMTPLLEHSGGVNHTGAIRYAVYFRFVEPVA